jgi:hypothetical protein
LKPTRSIRAASPLRSTPTRSTACSSVALQPVPTALHGGPPMWTACRAQPSWTVVGHHAAIPQSVTGGSAQSHAARGLRSALFGTSRERYSPCRRSVPRSPASGVDRWRLGLGIRRRRR